MRLGLQHVRIGGLAFRQQKTGNLLESLIRLEFQQIIASSPTGHLTFLTTGNRAPFSAPGFGNIFREWCDETELAKECSSHGLRKAACRRFAEAGCSEHQIAAISGHERIAGVRRYTKAARQVTMADGWRPRQDSNLRPPA